MADKKPSKPAKKNVEGRWNLYETKSGLKRLNTFCPKCKSFLAKHSDRLTCGQCGYMEKLKQ